MTLKFESSRPFASNEREPKEPAFNDLEGSNVTAIALYESAMTAFKASFVPVREENSMRALELGFCKAFNTTSLDFIDGWTPDPTKFYYIEGWEMKKQFANKEGTAPPESRIMEVATIAPKERERGMGFPDGYRSHPKESESAKSAPSKYQFWGNELDKVLKRITRKELEAWLEMDRKRMGVKPDAEGESQTDLGLLNECYEYLCYERDVRLDRTPELLNLIDKIEGTRKP